MRAVSRALGGALLALGIALAWPAVADPRSEPPASGPAPAAPEAPASPVPSGEASPAAVEPESPATASEEPWDDELEWDPEQEQEEGSESPAERDPFERVNRSLFGFNRLVDRFLLDPITQGYGWLVPEPGKAAVRRVFTNLNSPLTLVNDLLQLHPRRAGCTGARFVVNSTVGFGGIFDVAQHLGLELHHSDFGQTLGRYGVAPGPYLVLPILGPHTARDAVGGLVDTLFRLDTWLLSPGGRFLLAGGQGLATKEAYLREYRELERSSVDFYAAVRLLYLESRDAAVREARHPSGKSTEAEPAQEDASPA